MLNFKKFNLLEKKYDYEFIYIKLNSEVELIKFYDFLDNLLKDGRVMSRSLLDNNILYPNYFQIQTDINDNFFTYIGWLCDVPNDEILDDYIYNEPNTDSHIYDITELNKIKFIVNSSNLPNYNKSRELVYESKYNNYPYDYVTMKVYSVEEVTEVYDFLDKIDSKKTFNRKLIYNIERYPNFLFIETDVIKNTEKFYINYLSNTIIDQDMIDRNITNNSSCDKEILTIKDLNNLKSILTTGRKNIDYNKPRELVYESKDNKKTLYAFDLDETLVFSDRFEEKVKYLLLEYVTPETIFLNKLKEYNINLSQLKYENGRIYFTDPMNKFEIDEYNQDWVRKKDRVYLTQPEEYLLTDESTPIGSYKKIVDLYNSVDNKCIITARSEKLRRRTEKELKTFGIETPNYGLFMFSENKFSIKSKYKCDVLLNLQHDNNFDEINYYDDNIRLLKKMKHYLKDFDININFYKVTKNEYRKI